jgi:hypothetical protein
MESRRTTPATDEGGTTMFGPLPVLHRIVLAAISVCFGVIAGMWVAHSTSLPVAVSAGALAGGMLGLGAAYVLGHSPEVRPVRITRRH